MSGGVPEQSFAIVSNGFGEGPPQALRDYLVSRGAHVFTILHPLTREEGTRHVITEYAKGAHANERIVRLPLGPPMSYAVDPLVPLVPPRVDAWFGFNPLACARGLLARRQGRAPFVAQWSIDFVPDRFGPGNPMTRMYDRLDELCCTRADARIELTEVARDARNLRHGLTSERAHAHVVPMGAWLDRVETTPSDGFRRPRVVFLGHLVERQGVDVLLDAVALLSQRRLEIRAEIVGGGPLEARLKAQAQKLGLDGVVHFHGFVPDFAEVRRILAGCSVAVAPYQPTDESFTRYADPGKLKAYLAAGLPILLTDVPPNARELAREGGAEIVAYDGQPIADALERILGSPEHWQERRRAALAYAQRFDWDVLLPDLLKKLGLKPQ